MARSSDQARPDRSRVRNDVVEDDKEEVASLRQLHHRRLEQRRALEVEHLPDLVGEDREATPPTARLGQPGEVVQAHVDRQMRENDLRVSPVGE